MSDEEKIRPEEENHIGRHMAPTPPPAEEPVKAAGVPATPERRRPPHRKRRKRRRPRRRRARSRRRKSRCVPSGTARPEKSWSRNRKRKKPRRAGRCRAGPARGGACVYAHPLPARRSHRMHGRHYVRCVHPLAQACFSRCSAGWRPRTCSRSTRARRAWRSRCRRAPLRRRPWT